ncbi:MAG: molybdopterin molybdotransferase MoeA [Tepidisphaerales bacterium]
MNRSAEMLAPDQAVALMLDRVAPVGQEDVEWHRATNRVLAQAIVSDRDSPPADVSAMDGYAVRLRDVGGVGIDVAGEILPGEPATQLPAGKTMRIVTGALVPVGAEAVVRREDVVVEKEDHIELPPGFTPRAGENIRRRGENAPAGTEVLPSGALLGPAAISAVAASGAARLRVHRRVRLGILVTGSELHPVESLPRPWEIRDSNGPQLAALAAGCPWIELIRRENVIDVESRLEEQLAALLQDCDAILLTGGVSMGSHDFVPAVVRSLGATVLFHRLPIRPGKPIMGAISPAGQPVLALPGNPVSVLTTACRFAGPVFRRLAGMREVLPHRPMVLLDKSPTSLALWRFPAIGMISDGRARLLPSRGSGDIVGIAQSDGFVEIPPDAAGDGPYTLWRWEW